MLKPIRYTVGEALGQTLQAKLPERGLLVSRCAVVSEGDHGEQSVPSSNPAFGRRLRHGGPPASGASTPFAAAPTPPSDAEGCVHCEPVPQREPAGQSAEDAHFFRERSTSSIEQA